MDFGAHTLGGEPVGGRGITEKDIKYRRSIEYEAISTEVYRLALSAIGEETRERAVVLDLDETVLDNTQYQIESKGAFTPGGFDAWTRRKSAGVVPGAKEFLDKARALPGVHLVFITDRTVSQEADTLENMRRLGLFKEGDLILNKKDRNDTKDVRRRCVETAEDARCQAEGPLPIVALFGDSARDFEEWYGTDMLEKGRRSIVANAGIRYWVIPNPMYGQWETDYRH